MGKWQLQEAKARFSEVIRRAQREGPQVVTVHRRAAAVILSAEEFEALKKKEHGFVRFLRSSPLAGLELDIQRDTSPVRDWDL